MDNLADGVVPNQGDAIALKLEAKEGLILRLMQLSHCPGISVAVLHRGEIVLCRGYGLADVEKQTPATADTVYPIASVSKAFAAAACGFLVEEGHLTWDDPIAGHFPAFSPIHLAEAAKKITIVDVLSHRTGLRDQPCLHQGPNGMPLFDDEKTLLEVINSMPGTDSNFRRVWQYNPLPYALIEPLVKKMTGETLANFMRSRVFGPLGMLATSVAGDTTDETVQLAQPYTATTDGQRIARKISPKAYKFPVNAAMGVWSSAADMMKWTKAVMESYNFSKSESLSRPPLPQISTILHRWCPLPPGLAGSPAYCLGWFHTRGYHISDDIFDDDESPRVLPLPTLPPEEPPQTIFFHSGTGNGCISSLTLYPDTSSAVIVLANSSLCGDAADAVALVLSSTLRGYSIDEAALECSVEANAAWETGRWSRISKELGILHSKVKDGKTWPPEQIIGVYHSKIGLTIAIDTDQDQSLYICLGNSDTKLALRPFSANMIGFLPEEHDFQALGMGYMGHWCQFVAHLHFSVDFQRVVGIWWKYNPEEKAMWFSLSKEDIPS